jgi:GrpB-like predicted nucleotidyltransferase (UPF0157 family)
MRRQLVVDYDEQWPLWFDRIKEYLSRFLENVPISIEHVGSTAIPGMSAKPIIDIIVVIKKDNFDDVRRRLTKAGYVHQGDLGIVGREAFDLVDPDSKRNLPTHYLYVCGNESDELKRQMRFRDFLRNNKEHRDWLSQLKCELARKYKGDRKQYMAGKARMVKRITELAEKHFDDNER